MDKQRVLLLCVQSLLGESLENILSQEESVELIGPWDLDAPVLAQLSRDTPDVVLVAETESESEKAAALIAQILDHYPNVTVIRVGLGQDTVRVYTSHAVPARAADLLEAIRGLSAHHPRNSQLQA
jgi:DNA-binding NarL/FixJ family response regulator